MKKTYRLINGMIASLLLATSAFAGDAALEKKFDGLIDPAEMNGWLETMAAEPNHVGAPHNKANAEMTLKQFQDWGWDARIETFRALYPTPIKVSFDLLGDNGFSATLTESPIEGDAPTFTDKALPAYLGYQGDGDVTAPVVYVNYGMPDDYETLKRMGVDVKGKIVIARYGAGWRGLKPKLAQEHGAVGCIIYSDPHEDGYAVDDFYPKGASRPPQGVQRGSVMDMPTYPGDPLTPGRGATEKAKRLSRKDAKTLLKIPAIPMSYGDARKILAAMGGQVAPEGFRGSLGETYHIGDDGAAKAHLVVQSDWSLKPVYNVVATMRGAEFPDEWILRGNHRDGWVMGASDPLSGHIAMMGEAKAIGALVRDGWKPKRTIVYLSWDAEEPGLIGSTEYAETHEDELVAKALLYINSDGNGRGFLNVAGSHSLQHFANEIAVDVDDPQTDGSVDQRARAQLMIAAAAKGADGDAKKLGALAANPSSDLPIDALGSGSDYTAFLQHLGMAALHVGYYGEGDDNGVYHSLYDDFAHHNKFVDPGSAYGGALARTIGRMVLRIADAELPPVRYGDFASTVSDYLDEVKALADDRRARADAQAAANEAGAFARAHDPKKPYGAPTVLKPVPHVNFAPLEDAVDHLKKSAAAYDAALAEKGPALAADKKRRLFALAREAEQALKIREGLPGRPWFRNSIYAPGTLTGYGVKTLPGVREAIEQERFADADKYSALTAAAINSYAAKLDSAVKLMND
ncbi:MAG: folate hydrolase [Alphaproteobacteria bacterium RIFCSPHIGHO2_12_FULL_63_12]|nr:MAG: folate hydrolase [Alphaproteobacteria bacterium RIFCSPHIGHO2_12_FULL_63_12]